MPASARRKAPPFTLPRAALLVTSALGLVLTFAACGSSDDRLPPRSMAGSKPDAGDDGFDGGIGGGPPPPDASGLCGNELHQTVVDAPNLYFILDASGSMAAPAGSGTRYDAVRVAVVDLVRKLGPLVKVGAAVLPGDMSDFDACQAGKEVFPVKQGDPITGEEGPTTKGLRFSTLVKPEGGTPVSATLKALTPKLTALSGKTFVLLATDGGPNCNNSASCDADACMTNMEGQCDPSVNCCAPGGSSGPALCVDQDATVAAIEALKGAGINVFIVGIPGSETYAGVLDLMAKAGGSTNAASPFYYQVTDLSALGEALAAISSVTVKCEYSLLDPPSEQGMTNVYLDQQMLPYDDPDGWVWMPPSTVALLGEACARLKNGEVKQVQIVSGCPTGTAK
jgi:hypothetical protein